MLSAQVGLGAPAASLLPFVGGPLTDVISRRIFSFQRSQEEIFLLACIREKTGILTTLLVQIIFDFFQNQMIISKNPQFTGISARQQLEFTTHLLLTD